MREPDLSSAAALHAAYAAKASAELAAADALTGAPASARAGLEVGARIAFVCAHVPDAGSSDAVAAVLGERVWDAAAKAAEALGAGESVFAIASRPILDAAPDARVARLRLAIEAVDPPAVIALDEEAATDLAEAFGIDALRPAGPVRAFGRSLGSAGDFEASLDDPAAKARAWSAMKATCALAGLKAKGRQKAPLQKSDPEKD